MKHGQIKSKSHLKISPQFTFWNNIPEVNDYSEIFEYFKGAKVTETADETIKIGTINSYRLE